MRTIEQLTSLLKENPKNFLNFSMEEKTAYNEHKKSQRASPNFTLDETENSIARVKKPIMEMAKRIALELPESEVNKVLHEHVEKYGKIDPEKLIDDITHKNENYEHHEPEINNIEDELRPEDFELVHHVTGKQANADHIGDNENYLKIKKIYRTVADTYEPCGYHGNACKYQNWAPKAGSLHFTITPKAGTPLASAGRTSPRFNYKLLKFKIVNSSRKEGTKTTLTSVINTFNHHPIFTQSYIDSLQKNTPNVNDQFILSDEKALQFSTYFAKKIREVDPSIPKNYESQSAYNNIDTLKGSTLPELFEDYKENKSNFNRAGEVRNLNNLTKNLLFKINKPEDLSKNQITPFLITTIREDDNKMFGSTTLGKWKESMTATPERLTTYLTEENRRQHYSIVEHSFEKILNPYEKELYRQHKERKDTENMNKTLFEGII